MFSHTLKAVSECSAKTRKKLRQQKNSFIFQRDSCWTFNKLLQFLNKSGKHSFLNFMKKLLNFFCATHLPYIKCFMLEKNVFSKLFPPLATVFTNFHKTFLEKIQLTLCVSFCILYHSNNQSTFASLNIMFLLSQKMCSYSSFGGS